MGAFNERLAEVLKRKRQRDRLTQSDLGGRIGVSGSYISSLESGQSSARITEIEQLAQVFRTSAFDLLAEAARDDGYRFSEASRERNAFLSLYDQLAPEQQKMARAFLLFLREQQERPGQEGANV